MPPQIKQDINNSGHESTDFPSVCERCLPDNPYVQMLKEDYGAECKLCTRPFTIFRWKADRTARQKKTVICLTCARLKQCCQCCMLDLMFGLPLSVRDAALKMVAPGPQSNVNREYYAQNHEREIEEGRGGILDEYNKAPDKARELLSKLANSNTYYGRQRQLEAGEGSAEGQKALPAPGQEGDAERHTAGPVRTRDSRPRPSAQSSTRGGRGPAGRGGKAAASAPITPDDYLPPADPNIVSLFVTGVEDDLPEHELRTYFSKFGQLRSLICSHRSHCAFVNYVKREGAETAAMNCQGKAIVAGVPLRIRWGKPKTLDTMDKDDRMKYAREGRAAAGGKRGLGGPSNAKAIEGTSEKEDLDSLAPMAAPPGSEDVKYASLAGD